MRVGIQKEKKKRKAKDVETRCAACALGGLQMVLNGRVNGGGGVVNTRDEGRAEQVG